MPDNTTLNLRLLKDVGGDPIVALKAGHQLSELPSDDANTRVFSGQAFTNKPRWRTFFPQKYQVELEKLKGAGPAAVIFKRVSYKKATDDGVETVTQRWLAACFGSVYFSLDIEQFESHFGIKVALTKSTGKLHSVDFRKPEEGTILTRSQSSKPSPIFEFGIDAYNSILQSISTWSADPKFGVSLSGADALKISSKVDFDTLEKKLEEILVAYFADLPPDIEEWYGNIIPVKDADLLERLDTAVVNQINAGVIQGLHLAPPEIVEGGSVESIKFTGQGKAPAFESLSLRNYKSVRNIVTLDQMKSDRVKIQAENSDSFFDKWTVYKSLSAEIELTEGKFVLSAGHWYEVAADYVERINSEYENITAFEFELPSYTFGTTEGKYNTDSCNGTDELIYFDKNLVAFKGERGRIEFCDMLHKEKCIIHVKKRTSSSTMSHLFAQVYASAEAFFEYESLREQVRATSADVAAIIPAQQPVPSDYRVVLAFMDEGRAYLPFLSKIGLANVVRNLNRMGYKPRLAWIEANDSAAGPDIQAEDEA